LVNTYNVHKVYGHVCIQHNTYFACNANAIIPDATGQAAEVP